MRKFLVIILLYSLSLSAGCKKSETPATVTAEKPTAAVAVEPVQYKEAREILGQDFISPEEVELGMARSGGIASYGLDIELFHRTLPPEEVVKWCKANDYMLVAGPPLPVSFSEIRGLHPEFNFGKGMGYWYEGMEFDYKDTVKPGWLMLRKGPVPNSNGYNWHKQQKLLSEVERVPNLPEVAWGITIYHHVRRVYLLSDTYVRTSSIGPDGWPVVIGQFKDDSMAVLKWNPDDPEPNSANPDKPLTVPGIYFGIAAARKMDLQSLPAPVKGNKV